MRVKMSKPPPPAPTASAIGPCPTTIKIVGTPALEVYPGPSHHPTTPCPTEIHIRRTPRQTTPVRTYSKRNRPLPYYHQNCRHPGTGSLPSTFAPPDHPLLTRKNLERIMFKSVQSKRKCFIEKGSWQGIHRGQFPPFIKKEWVIKV